jgi:DNA-binding NtrC family response regulator
MMYFQRSGHRAVGCNDAESALEQADLRAFDVAVLDMAMPGMSGLELLEKMKTSHPECELVMLTGHGTIELAVEAMKKGAFDFLTKPVRLSELEAVLSRACDTNYLRRENRQLRAALDQQSVRNTIIGASPAMEDLFRLLQRIGNTDNPVLIEGESGTGKELVARAIHAASSLRDMPLVVVNCAALPETLLESELFGHEKGAFTGAVASKPGLFEVADGGSLFIDEIGELAGNLQAKLLRVLEDGSLRRIGSVKERRVRVRLIAATNRDMLTEVQELRFREDLYYRINVLTIVLPPLRDRVGDVELLVRHFAGPDWQLADNLLPELARYSWPGNVRQLSNAIERAKILADDEVIRLENFPPEILRYLKSSAAQEPPSIGDDLESRTRNHVVEAYDRCGRNKARTARMLGIGRRSLYRLLEKYGIHESM